MKRIPIAAAPAQTFSITLGGQVCKITLTQRPKGIFVDVFVAGVAVVQGAVCLDRTRIVRYGYAGFIGDIAFIDTQGKSDPDYTGFNDRFVLVYLEATDL